MLDRSRISVFLFGGNNELLNRVEKILGKAKIHSVTVDNRNKLLQMLRNPVRKTLGGTALMLESTVVLIELTDDPAEAFDLCQRIKKPYPKTQVVFIVTGDHSPELQTQIVSLRADEFIQPDALEDELIYRIEMAVIRHARNYAKIPRQKVQERTTALLPSEKELPKVGGTIASYKILDTLGWGDGSVVYKVLNSSRKVLAVKLLTEHSLDFGVIVTRFQNEIEILARISHHPNIIGFYDIGEYDSNPFVVMDYINGITLEEYLIVYGCPGIDMILKTAKELGEAINAAHQAKIVHRNISLDKVFYALDTQRCILTDFGFAKDLDLPDLFHDEDQQKKIRKEYQAPEVIDGGDATIQSDVYSFGMAMYHFITGDLPIDNAPPQPFSHPEAPVELQQLIIEQCLNPKQNQRPQSLVQVLEKLEQIKPKPTKQ